jgi:hypothetical protein
MKLVAEVGYDGEHTVGTVFKAGVLRSSSNGVASLMVDAGKVGR